MLTFNNKILTVSNKGLEVEAGPTPPPYELVKEIQTTSFNTQYGDVIGGWTKLAPIDRDFLALKFTVTPTRAYDWSVCGAGLNAAASGHNTANIWGGWNGASSKITNSTANSLGMFSDLGDYKADADYAHAGTNGNKVLDYYDSMNSMRETYIQSSPVETVTAGTPFDVKVIFDISGLKVYTYINNKYIGYDQLKSIAYTDFYIGVIGQGTADCKVYACDTLTDAEGV